MRLRDGDRLSSVALVAEQRRRRRAHRRRETRRCRAPPPAAQLDEIDLDEESAASRARRPRRSTATDRKAGSELEARQHRHARQRLDVPVEGVPSPSRSGRRLAARRSRGPAARLRVRSPRSSAGRPRERPVARRASSRGMRERRRAQVVRRARSAGARRPGRRPSRRPIRARSSRCASSRAERAAAPRESPPAHRDGQVGRARSRVSCECGVIERRSRARAVVDRAQQVPVRPRPVCLRAQRPGLGDALDLRVTTSSTNAVAWAGEWITTSCAPSGGSSAREEVGDDAHRATAARRDAQDEGLGGV